VKILILTALLINTIAVTANSQTAGEYIHNPTGAIEEEFGEGIVSGIEYAENGTVYMIYGKLDKGITAVEPLDKCYEFFELHKDLFGLDNPREELVFYSDSTDIYTLMFRQFHNGIQIGWHRIIVYFSLKEKYSMIGVKGKFVTQVKNLSSTPAISEEEAIQIAANDYIAHKYKAEPKSGKTELRYLKESDGSYYLAWIIAIGNGGYHINAMTGNIKYNSSARSH